MTGGIKDSSSSSQHTSTEILTSGAKSWIFVGDLPKPIIGLSGTSFQNKIIISGETFLSESPYKSQKSNSGAIRNDISESETLSYNLQRDSKMGPGW